MNSRVVCQNRILLLGGITLLIISIILISTSISSLANIREKPAPTYKYYTSIVIEPGDTLWHIALEHASTEYCSVEDYIEEVKLLNHLADDDISAGGCLTIPYYSNEIL